MPTIAELYPELFGLPQQTLEQNKPGLVTSFKGAIGGSVAGAGRFLEDEGSDYVGPGLRSWGEGVQARNPMSPAGTSFEGFAENPGLGLRELVGAGLGYTLPALIPYAGPVARTLGTAGSVAAGTAMMAAPAYGGIRATQDQMGLSDPAGALTGALATGAIEQLGGVQRLFRPGMQGVVGNTPRHLLQEMRSTPLRTGLSTAHRVATGEALEEIAQNPIEQYFGGQDPTTSDRIHETLFGGFAGYVGGMLPFGAGAGMRRASQHMGAQGFVDQTLGNPNAGMDLQMDALEIQQQFTGDQDLRAQQLAALNEMVYQGMLRGEPVNMLQTKPPMPDVMEAPWHAGLGAMPQGTPIETDYNRAAGILQTASKLPEAQWDSQMVRDVEMASALLQRSLPSQQYEAFVQELGLSGGNRAQPVTPTTSAPRGSAPRATGQAVKQPSPTAKIQAKPTFASPYEQAYVESGGIYSPVKAKLGQAKTDEEALAVVRDVLENKKPSQKVMQALEEVHKKLSGQTMTQYLRAREAQETDPRKPGPVTITKGDPNAQANVPLQEVRQEAPAGQVPGQAQVGVYARAPGAVKVESDEVPEGAQEQMRARAGVIDQRVPPADEALLKRISDAARQTPLQGAAVVEKARAQPVQQVQAKARTEDQGAGREADRKQGQAQQVKRWEEQEPEDVQNFVLEKVAAQVGSKKTMILKKVLGWGEERIPTYEEVADFMVESGLTKSMTKQRVEQIWKELSRPGGAVDRVMNEHGIKPQHVRPKETTDEKPEGPAQPTSSLVARPVDAAAAGITDPEAEAGTVDRNTGFTTGDISKVNSSNITGELSTSVDKKTGETTAGKEFTYDQEGKANERAAAFEQAAQEGDVEGEAITVWDSYAHIQASQGETMRNWSQLAQTDRGRETQKAWVDFYTKQKEVANETKRNAGMLRRLRETLKQKYYTGGVGTKKVYLNQLMATRQPVSVGDNAYLMRAMVKMFHRGFGQFIKDRVEGFYVVPRSVIKGDAFMGRAPGRPYELYVAEDIWVDRPRKNGFIYERMFLHELEHVVDDVAAEVGNYSNDSRLAPGGFVFAEVKRVVDAMEGDGRIDALFNYPMGKKYFDQFDTVLRMKELYAQIMSAYHVSQMQAVLKRYFPNTYRYAEQTDGKIQAEAATGTGVFRGRTSDARAGRPGELAGGEHRAFHGTPHEVDRFTTQKIGTGEGAQAYGWGMYFASNKAVAKYYRDNLSRRGTIEMDAEIDDPRWRPGGTRVRLDPQGFEPGFNLAADTLDKKQGDVAAAIQHIEHMAGGLKRTDGSYPGKFGEALSYLKDWAKRNPKWVGKAGKIYEVELAPELDEYLDWDKPLVRQSDKVKKAFAASPTLQEALKDVAKKFPGTLGPEESVYGDKLYEAVVGIGHYYTDLTKHMSAEEWASRALLEAGIPGLKYLDAGSRGRGFQGNGNHNFVIFDDSLVSITGAESRGLKDEGLPEREAFKPQLHEGFAKAVEEVAAAVKSGDRVRERNARSKTIPIGRTPVVLRAITTITGEKPFRKSDFVIGNGSTIYLKGMDEHQASAHGWAVPVETLKQLPQLLADPVAVFRSGERSSDSDSYKVVLDAEVAGKPVIAAIKPNRPQQEFGGETAHFTVTLFPLRNGWSQVGEWNELGLLRYYDDKRAPAVQPGTYPQGLTGARGTRPDFSVGVVKAPVKVVTKTQIEGTPKAYYSQGITEAMRDYPTELKPGAGMVRDYIKDAATNWVKKGLQAVVFSHDLANIAVKEGLSSAKGFFDLINAKQAKRIQLEAEVDRIMTAAADLTDRTAVNDFLRDSTRGQKWGYAPAWKPAVEVDSVLEQRYNRLSELGKQTVDAVFRRGEESYAEKQRLVNQEINAEFDAQLLKAGTQDERDAIEKARAKQIRTMGRVLPKMQGPYAPFKRFGNYVSVAKSEAYLDAVAMNDTKLIEELQQDDRHYLVEFHDSFPAAKARARQLQPFFKLPKAFERQMVHKELTELPWGAIAKVKQHIADMPDDTQHKAALSRLLTDIYLTMLSEGSARKAELRRRGIHGEERNMLQSFAAQGRADAHFISALEKNGEIQKQISAMQTEAKQDEENRNRVLNEILARYAQAIDYRPTPWTNKAMAMTSFWMLVTTPSYYLQNSTQPFMLTLPVLSGRFGNGAAWAALTKAYKDVARFFRDVGHGLDIDKLPLSEDERAMLRTLRDQGKIDLTIAQDLGRWSEGPTTAGRVAGAIAPKTKSVFDNVMRKIWAAPHQVEMLNRVTSALAAYRLSKGSLEYTSKIIDDTHGNYAASNAPRFMHANAALRLITQFRKFQLIQISLLGKTLYNTFKGATPDERAAAKATLGWLLAHHMVMAGALGLPTANLVGWLLSAAFGDDDEPKDFERMVRRAIGDEDLSNLILRGVPAGLGLDVSGRIGMGTAFALLPFSKVDLLGKRDAMETVAGAAGAFPSVLLGISEGADYLRRGDIYKGFELMLPRGLRDGLRAYRFATDGISQKNNDVVMKPSELSMFDVMSQAVGLPSTALQARSRRVGDVFETDEYYKDRTGTMRHRYAAAYRENDLEEMQDLREEWAQVAAAMRRQGLKPQPLSNLLRAPREQLKRERDTVEGVQTRKSNREFVRQGAQL